MRRKSERYTFIIRDSLILSMIALHGTSNIYTFFMFSSLKISLKSNTLLLILVFIHRCTLSLALRSHAAHAISISASSASLRTADGIERKSVRFSKGLGSATRVPDEMLTSTLNVVARNVTGWARPARENFANTRDRVGARQTQTRLSSIRHFAEKRERKRERGREGCREKLGRLDCAIIERPIK